jgi:holo-[acyl-carrier protein] synthase
LAAGIGIDLLEIGRLERALGRRPRLTARIFTDAEREYADARARPARHLAARFAAKEAVIKALGITDALGLRDIEIVPGPPPTVRLSGRAAEAAAGRTVSISLTHSNDHAAAVAILEP